MPNAKVLSEKQAVVAALTERLQKTECGVLVNYEGITVAQDTELRSQLRESNVEYSVIKNTLARFAIDAVGYKELDPYLNGTTSLATSNDDPIAPIRVLSQFAKKLNNGKFAIKGAFMDGKILSADEISAMSELPSKQALQAQVLGTMLAPISGLAFVLSQIAEKQGAPAAEAEPAAAE